MNQKEEERERISYGRKEITTREKEKEEEESQAVYNIVVLLWFCLLSFFLPSPFFRVGVSDVTLIIV